jgi:hypothetical protein
VAWGDAAGVDNDREGDPGAMSLAHRGRPCVRESMRLSDDATETNSGASSEALKTAVQVAKRLGVSERWVRDHATRRSPRLPVVKLGSLLRFRPEDIEQFIVRQRHDHTGTSRIK